MQIVQRHSICVWGRNHCLLLILNGHLPLVTTGLSLDRNEFLNAGHLSNVFGLVRENELLIGRCYPAWVWNKLTPPFSQKTSRNENTQGREEDAFLRCREEKCLNFLTVKVSHLIGLAFRKLLLKFAGFQHVSEKTYYYPVVLEAYKCLAEDINECQNRKRQYKMAKKIPNIWQMFDLRFHKLRDNSSYFTSQAPSN